MVPILLFSFFHSHLSVSFTIRHPIAPQDKPVPNQHEPRAADQHATYHCFMATLWQLYGNFMGDPGDDGDDGDHGS